MREKPWVSSDRLESRYPWGYTARLEMFFRRIALSEKIDLSNFVLDEGEEFMNARQRAYFRAKLNAWKNDILREARETLDHLAEESANHRTSRTGRPRKPTVPSSFGLATASAS
jgi:hypothetical protein